MNVSLVEANQHHHYQHHCNDSGGDHVDSVFARVHFQQNDQPVMNNYGRANLAPSLLSQRVNEENVVVNDSRHEDRERVDVDLDAHDRLIVLLNGRPTDIVFGDM
jgi:hypothetical protein